MAYVDVRTLVSQLSSLGLNPDAAINCHPRCFTGRVIHQYLSSLGWTLNGRPVCQH